MIQTYWLDNVAALLGDPGFQGMKLIGGLSLNKSLLKKKINDARRIVSKKTLCYIKQNSITTVVDQPSYDFPDDFEFLAARPGDRSYFTGSDSTVYPLTGFSYFDYLKLKSDSSGTPRYVHIHRGLGKIFVYPACDTAVTNGLTVMGRCLAHSQDNDDANTDGILEEYQDLVYAKVLADLHPDAQVRKEQMGLFMQGCMTAVRELAKEAGPQGVAELDTDWGIP